MSRRRSRIREEEEEEGASPPLKVLYDAKESCTEEFGGKWVYEGCGERGWGWQRG